MRRTRAIYVWIGWLSCHTTTKIQAYQQIQHRDLGEDFTELNALLRGAVFQLPDYSGSDDGLILEFTLTNLQCMHLSIDDVIMEHEVLSSTSINIQLEVQQLNMVCQGEYSYKTWLFEDSGTAVAALQDNTMTTNTTFMSSNFSHYPPTLSTLESCVVTVNVNQLNLSAPILGLAPIESFLSRLVETQAQGFLCEILSRYTTTNLEDLLTNASNFLEKYYDGGHLDPLQLEQDLIVPVPLVNWQANEKLQLAWKELISYLSSPISESGKEDMRLNDLLRDTVLEADRALVLNLSTPLIYHRHDRLTETTIAVESMTLIGLDTFSTFEPMQAIGNQTLQNSMSWEYLICSLNVTIYIQPSTMDDSYIETPSETKSVVEHVTLQLGLNHVDAMATFLLAVNEQRLGSTQISQVLSTVNILPCLLYTMVDLQFASLFVNVTTMVPPTMDGFVSNGIDRVTSRVLEAIFDMYEDAVLDAAPAMFQTVVRDYLNEQIRNKLLVWKQQVCHAASAAPPSEGEFIDWRDLLLMPDAALAAGTKGLQPYGNISSLLLTALEEKVITEDLNGEPKINSIIRSFAEARSGTSKRVTLSTDLFNWTRELNTTSVMERIEFHAFNASLENLDTIVSPLLIMNPIDAYSLANTINLGPVDSRPLTLEARFLFRVFGGEESRLNMNNDVLASFSVSSVNIAAQFYAAMVASNLLRFPLKDLADVHCWLATFASNEDSRIRHEHDDGAIGLESVNISLSDLRFNVSCVACTSPGASALPGIIDAVQNAGIMEVFTETLEQLIEEIAEGYWNDLHLPHVIGESKTLCKHSPYFNGTATSTFVVPTFPTLSRHAVESVLALGLHAAEFACIVIAQSHLLRQSTPSNPLSGQASLKITEDMHLIDWTNLTETIGIWADRAFSEALNHVAETVDGQVRFNVMLKDRILNDEGRLSMEVDSIGFDLAGTFVSLASVSIGGLDSASKINFFNVLGSQTFNHYIEFDHLDVRLSFVVKSEPKVRTADDQPVSISIVMTNVTVDFATLVAVDLVQLRDIELQSLLHVSHLLPCLLSRLHGLSITEMLVTVGKLGDPTVEGVLARDVKEKISLVGGKLFDIFRADLATAMPTIFDTTIKEVFNTALRNYRTGLNGFCRSVPVSANLIDLRDLLLSETLAKRSGTKGDSPYGDTFRLLFDALQNQLSAVDATNRSAINDLFIIPLTKALSNSTGVVVLDGILINVSAPVVINGFKGEVTCMIRDARFENLDSIGEPLLLQPLAKNGYMLNNTAAFGVGSRPTRLATTVLVSISDGKDVGIRNEFDITLEVKNAMLYFTIYLAVSQAQFFEFPLKDSMNFNCWLSTLSRDAMSYASGYKLLQYGATARYIDLNVSCLSCSSPRFDELLSKLYSPGRREEDARSFVNNTLTYVDMLIGSDFLHNAVRRILDDAATQCPHHAAYDTNAQTGGWWTSPVTYLGFDALDHDTKISIFSLANAVIAALFVCAAVIARYVVKERNRKIISALPQELKEILIRKDEADQQELDFLNEHSNAMCNSEFIPQKIRVMVPFMIMCNIGLYLGGHLGLLAFVNVQGQIAGEEFYVDRFLEFSFFTSMIKAFRNGGAEMGVLVIVFAGIWPYVKLITALLLWFFPPTRVSVSRRGSVLLWMDVLTKLSIVDIFMMSVAIAALLVYLGGPDRELQTSSDLYNVKVICMPFWAFYSILIAQRMNRVSTRFLLDYHKRILAMTIYEYKIHKLRDVGSVFSDPEGQTIDLTRITQVDSDSINQEKSDDYDDEPASDNGRVGPAIQRHPHNPAEAVIWMKDSFDEASIPRPLYLFSWNQGPSDSTTSMESSTRMSVEIGMKRNGYHAGTIGVFFAGITSVFILLIGISLAPAVSLDVNSILTIALDSGWTFQQAVSEYNVFRLITLILLKARFVLNSKWDYIGLGICLLIGIVASATGPVMLAYSNVKQWLKLRKAKRGPTNSELPRLFQSSLDHVWRLRAWKSMEVFITSFVIASWQLGAVTAYVIHSYCDLLRSLFAALSYIGLVERTHAQCFLVQSSARPTIVILISSFALLLVSFTLQARGQYLKNLSAMRAIESSPTCSQPDID